MSATSKEKHDEMPSDRDMAAQNVSMPGSKSVDDDSDSSPPERPTSLSIGSTYNTISVDESLENERYFLLRIKAEAFLDTMWIGSSYMSVSRALLFACFYRAKVFCSAF